MDIPINFNRVIRNPKRDHIFVAGFKGNGINFKEEISVSCLAFV